MPITKFPPKLLDKLTTLRRKLHRYPELAYQEHKTAKIVSETLTALGLKVHSGIAETGVVGVLEFDDKGPSIGFRADMDALPIVEETNVEYASKHAGVMHACGHDGHTAMLLGAADLLSKRKDLTGRIVFIFQPAEENEGGAKRMLEDGLIDRFPIEKIYALHNMPSIPVGTVMVKAGYVSASFDTFDIVIEGQGGHGAMPETTHDPIPAVSALILSLNTIVSRNIKPTDSAVLTVGTVQGGQAFNIIPDTVAISGSCRSHSKKAQKILKQRIFEVCEGIGIAYDVKIKCSYEERYPPVFNDEIATQALWSVLSKPNNGIELIKDFTPLMGSEDFAFMSEKVPGSYFIIGNGDECGPLHSPTYNFSDSALPIGLMCWVNLANILLERR